MSECRRVAGNLVDYAFRDMEEEEACAVEDHLRACLHCQATVAQYREMLRLLLRLDPIHMPPGVAEQLRVALLVPAP